MVAKGVQRATTTTDGNTRRERQAETAKQQQTEQVRLDARVKARWRSGQSSTGHGTALRPEESLLSVVQPGHQAGVTEVALDPGSGFVLPTRAPSARVIQRRWGWARTSNQSGPRWWFKPHHARQIPTTILCFDQGNWTHTPVTKASTKESAIARCLVLTMGRVSAQLAQQADCLDRTALRSPNPPSARGKEAVSLARTPASKGTRRISHMHRHNPSSCPMAKASVSDDSELAVGPATCTVKEQSPRALDVLHHWDALQKSAVIAQNSIQVGCNEVWVTKRSSQNFDALQLSGQSRTLPH